MSGLLALEANVNESSALRSILPADRDARTIEVHMARGGAPPLRDVSLWPELMFMCFGWPLQLSSVMLGKEFHTIYGHAHHRVTSHAQ